MVTGFHQWFNALAQQGFLVLRFLAAPHSRNKDLARREGILNILLLGCICLVSVAVIVAFCNEIRGEAAGGATKEVGIICLFFVGAYVLSRMGRSRLVAQAIILLLFLATTSGVYRWGADLPQALLTYALIVVMSSILVGSRFSFIVTILIGVSLLAITALELFVWHSAIPSWRNTDLTMGDSITAAITLGVMNVVSWLFNREMEHSLKRARVSEAALKRQRNQLEVIVERRTAELKRVQAEKIVQLYRLAEFGKATSGLFHDLVNPLTLISLNLDALSKQMKQQELDNAQVALKRAVTGTRRLEHFVQTVKKQLQEQQITRKFYLNDEVEETMQVVAYKARKEQVTIQFHPLQKIWIFGDPMKFSQLLANLLANAIDAYDGVKSKKRVVEVRLSQLNQQVKLEVQDWGCGVDPKNISRIFDSLFTTKGSEKGTGIGLAICKDIIVRDLQGTYTVESHLGKGTTFSIEFPANKTPKKTV